MKNKRKSEAISYRRNDAVQKREIFSEWKNSPLISLIAFNLSKVDRLFSFNYQPSMICCFFWILVAEITNKFLNKKMLTNFIFFIITSFERAASLPARSPVILPFSAQFPRLLQLPILSHSHCRLNIEAKDHRTVARAGVMSPSNKCAAKGLIDKCPVD